MSRAASASRWASKRRSISLRSIRSPSHSGSGAELEDATDWERALVDRSAFDRRSAGKWFFAAARARRNICSMAGDDHLAAAWEALRQGSRARAKASFEEALRSGETPQALEGLAEAAFWLEDAETAIDARERAFRLYREGGHDEGAARAAAMLAVTALNVRGDSAVASGWLRRAPQPLAIQPQLPSLDDGRRRGGSPGRGRAPLSAYVVVTSRSTIPTPTASTSASLRPRLPRMAAATWRAPGTPRSWRATGRRAGSSSLSSTAWRAPRTGWTHPSTARLSTYAIATRRLTWW